MKAIYFDLQSGAGGDMILASLIHLGVPSDYLLEQLGKLGIEGLKIATAAEKRHGITCARLELSWAEQKAYRHLPDILAMIHKGEYPEKAVKRAETVLRRIAEAEARVHDIAVEKVHFHEIGAADTIVDVLGCALGLDYLGVDGVFFSSLTVGHGTITTEHGAMPVPAPATAEMARGFAIRGVDVSGELLTPTGCAILTALGEQVGQMPAGRVEAIGYGCGTRRLEKMPNLLRAILLDRQVGAEEDTVCILETTLDHISGELMGFAAERLFEGGAVDVSWTPVFMKKGRPGYHLTVIAPPEKEHTLVASVIRHTRTLGVRTTVARRHVATRSQHGRTLLGREIIEKKACFEDQKFGRIEYESLAALARERNVGIMDILEEWSGKEDE
jgi:hypothetical protein